MSRNFVQSAVLRNSLLGAYRIYARAQVWRRGPRIFVNSIPKAGTHLLTAELEKFAALQNSRLHLDVSRIVLLGQRTAEGPPAYDIQKIERAIGTVRLGQFFSGHLRWSAELAALIARQDLRTIFMTRDPRDIMVSRLHYSIGLKRHWLHDLMTNRLSTEEERYRLLVDGRPADPFVLSLKSTLEGYLPWLSDPNVLTVKFEDLVGERGGGSTEAKSAALQRIASHCGIPGHEAEDIARSATVWTPTLRKGQANAWRGELPESIVRRVAEQCGPALEALGYPVD